MAESEKTADKGWSDPDDAPELTDDFFERAKSEKATWFFGLHAEP